MDVKTIRAADLTESQIAEWDDIQRGNDELDNPMLSVDFALAVAKVRTDLEIALLVQDDRTVGFFPYHRCERNVGRPLALDVTDLHGVVAAKDVTWSAAELIDGCGLATWKFDHLIASQRPFVSYHRCVEGSPFMDLSKGFDAYMAERKAAGSSAMSQALRKSRKIERELGPLRFVWHDDDEQLMQSLISLKQQQIRDRNLFDAFRFQWVLDLLEIIRQTQSARFSGLMSALYAGNHMLALHFGLRRERVVSSWYPTFDPQFARYSPGLILHLELARRAAELGVDRIDLGRGENQMKSTLMSGSIPVALGAVDRRLSGRLWTGTWYGLRGCVYASPLSGYPLQTFRRFRNLISSA